MADDSQANHKTKTPKKPTARQAKAIANLIENGGNASKAMRDAGYSEAMAHNPQRLMNSVAYTQLMDEAGIDDKLMLKTLKEGLEATKVIVMGKESNESFVDISPDHPTRHKFLETALRIKGIGKQETPSHQVFIKGDATFNANKYIEE